jgi:hypothetical protein
MNTNKKSETKIIQPLSSDLEGNFECKSETKWIISLEEDPETGDLVMPLPEELLKSQGWNIGDTLVWDFDDVTGTASLSKKRD